MSAGVEAAKRSEESQVSRRWKVGLAGVAGAVLIGVTGGLAAPLVAGAIGSVMGGLGLGATAAAGLLGTLSSSGVVVGSLFGAYGFGMTSEMMDRYAREVEDFAFVPMRRGAGQRDRGKEAEERRLRVTIGVSGWLSQRKDVLLPWRALGSQNEVFALRWEVDALMEMGKSLESMASSAVWAVASREIISRTVFASLMFAMWPIAVLKLSKIVDNPFNVAKSRADKAGLVLADAIINKAQGERPVTLIGYSMGARLIYSCLISLAERRAFGLIESVVLIGAPAPSDASAWRAIRSVVAGRLVNVYSEKDYILAFLYRTSSVQLGVAGLQAIQNIKGVENVDVTSLVSGHLRYPYLVGSILENIGWEDIDMQEVARGQKANRMLDKKEEEKKKEEVEIAPEQNKQNTAIEKLDEKGEVALCDRTSTKGRVPMRPARERMGIQKEIEYEISMHDSAQQHIIPMLHQQPPTKAEEEDLISFDDEPSREEAPNIEPQFRVYSSTEKRLETLTISDFDLLGHREEEERDHRIFAHDMKDFGVEEETKGIIMVDNEEGITMLEPIPLPDEDMTFSGKIFESTEADQNVRQKSNHARSQQAWEDLDFGNR